MSEPNFINYFKCIDYRYNNHFTAGSLVIFKHPCIGYLIKGRGEFLYEGKTYHADSGDVIYIARGSRYYSVWEGNPEIHFYSINYSFTSPADSDNYPFQIVKGVDREILDKVMNSYESTPLESLGLFYLFLNDFHKKLLPGRTYKSTETLMPALVYISEHYTEKIPISLLAEICNLSESRFYTKFKNAIGCTPIEYKNNLTIQKALDMLTNTEKSIEEISSELGFNTSSYFRKVFKSITGKNPKELKAQNK
ncbi:MAG: helix-turn-helix transcriptional regulator [Clostridia bacterium]|nr:helix-turn-helix transcriptional regulator [Clostridia bacterium]